MPHIREALARDVRRALKPGTMMDRRTWPDTETPHHHLNRFPQAAHVLAVTFAADGTATVTKQAYDRTRSRPCKVTVQWAPDAVVALVQTKPIGGNGPHVYAHYEDRLILPNGYLRARPGTMYARWDVVGTTAGTEVLLDAGVTVAGGRAILAALTI